MYPSMETSSSVHGKTHQIPVMFHMAEKRKASGIIITNPRSTDKIFAGSGRAVEVKKVEMTMLNPTNGQAVK